MDRPLYYRLSPLPTVSQLTIHDVVDVLDLNCNRGDAVIYLARAGKKPRTPAQDDVAKAWDCLTRELMRLGAWDELEPRLARAVVELKERRGDTVEDDED